MKTAHFVLCLIDVCGGSIQGRTLLQKRAFFVSELSDVELDFEAHYYGPFSAQIDSAVSQLKSLGFVDEAPIGFGIARGGFEMKRYDYRITEDGKEVVEVLREQSSDEYDQISKAFERIRAAGNPDYIELSIAAKAYFILKKGSKPMSRNELAHEAERFDWSITAHSLDGAIDFLEHLKLVK